MPGLRIEKVQNVFFWIVAGVVACLAFVYSKHTFPAETIPVTFPRETVFFTLAAVAIGFALLRGASELSKEKQIAFYLLAAFAAWSILATLWAVKVPGHARELIELAFFCGWAFALSTLAVPLKKVRNFTMILAFSGGIVGVAVAFGKIAFDLPLATWPFGNANAAGMFCAFAAVINSGLILDGLKKHKPHEPQIILPAVCVILALIGLGFTFSKGALVGLIIGEAVLAWRFFPDFRKWVAILTAVVVFGGVGLYIAAQKYQGNSLRDTTSGFRVMAWKASIKQIGDAPFGGSGLGSFYVYFPRHSQPEISGHPKMGDTVFHAHSNVLEIGTELGVVGMALFIAFIVYLGVLPLMKPPEDSERSRLEAIWLAGFLMITTHALVAVHFYWTESVLYFWTAAGILLALGREGKPVPMIKRGLPFLAVAAIALAGLWYIGVYEELKGRIHAANREKMLRVVRKLDKAYGKMIRMRQQKTKKFAQLQGRRMYLYNQIISELTWELGLVRVQRMRSDSYYQLGSAYYNIRHPREGLYYFKKVVADAPGYVNTDYFIGRAYEGIRQKEAKLHTPGELEAFRTEAITALERFLKFNVRAKMSGEATRFLAGIYDGKGQLPEAIKTINRHLEVNPKSPMKDTLIKYRDSLVRRLAQRSRRGARPPKQPPKRPQVPPPAGPPIPPPPK